MSGIVWPLSSPGKQDVFEFVRRSLPTCGEVVGPTQIFAQYEDGPDRRATALFETEHPQHKQVVVKANRFPLLKGSLEAHRLVNRLAPDATPRLLGSESIDGGSLLLLEVFEGAAIKDAKSLIATARTLARIQRSTLHDDASTSIPRVELADLLPLFDDCLATITRCYPAAWAQDDGKLEEAMGFPASLVLERLRPLRERVEDWISNLDSARISLSIDHGDCHSGNAIVRQDASILIFDWENASISHPFFSVEKLLTSAWALDVGAEGGPWGYKRDTPTQDLLRSTYLAEFSGDTSVQAAFDSAMCLAVVKEMHHEMEWARLCGWEHQNPEWTAQLVNRLFQHVQFPDRES